MRLISVVLLFLGNVFAVFAAGSLANKTTTVPDPMVKDSITCFPGVYKLKVPPPGTGTYTCLWYEDSKTQTVLFSGYEYTTPHLMATDTFWVEFTDGSDTGNRARLILKINPTPSIEIIAAPMGLCAPGEVSFTALTNQPGDISLTWTFGTGDSIKDTQKPKYTFKDPGYYPVSVSVVSKQGCRNKSDTVYITVFEVPAKPNLVGPTPAARGSEQTYSVPGWVSSFGSELLWTVTGGTILTLDSTKTILKVKWGDGIQGSVKVAARTPKLCTKSDEWIVPLFPASSGEYELPGFRVYPNPSSDEIILETPENAVYTIADILGKPIMEGVVVPGINPVAIHLLPAGTYFISLTEENSDGIVVKKITKY